jgi:hypothetical protein
MFLFVNFSPLDITSRDQRLTKFLGVLCRISEDLQGASGTRKFEKF